MYSSPTVLSFSIPADSTTWSKRVKGVREERVGPVLRHPAPNVRIPQHHEHDAQRRRHVHDPADITTNGYGAGPNRSRAQPSVTPHEDEADEKRQEPADRLPWAKREDRVSGHEKGLDHGRARPGNASPDRVGQRHPQRPEGNQRDDVALEERW